MRRDLTHQVEVLRIVAVMHWDGAAVAELDGMDTHHFNALFADSPGTFWAGIWRWNGSALVPHPLALAWPVTLNAVWGAAPTTCGSAATSLRQQQQQRPLPRGRGALGRHELELTLSGITHSSGVGS